MGKEKYINLVVDLNVDKQLEAIWSKQYGSEEVISPIFPLELGVNCVTYLSLNPSLPPNSLAKKGNYPDNPYPLISWEKESADYKFFKKFYELGNEIKPWTVLDLLYERDSKQDNLEIKYNLKTIDEKDKEFLLEQINLTFKILKSINPLVVVVSNAFANKLIHENIRELKLKQELPSIENNYVYKINGIPFITNESKFLGSRYLEKKSERLESLISEIKRILEITKFA